MTTIRQKSQISARVKQLLLGTKKHYPNAGTTLTLDGVPYTVTALTQLMQDFVDQRDGVEAARASLKAKVSAERSRAPGQLAVIGAFETVIRGTNGNAADVLAEFGLAPRKTRAPISAEKKAEATAKRKATRVARHTMGKNQKSKVKGDVTGITVTPIVTAPLPIAPPPPATPPNPAASAATSGTSTPAAATPHTA